MLKRTLIKLARLFALFLIVSFGILTLGVFGLAIWVELPAFHTIGWHLRHGNHVVFEGHSFRVPLMWDCDVEQAGKVLTIEELHPIFGGLSTIRLESTGKALDSAATHHWVVTGMVSFNQAIKSPDKLTSEVIQGRRLEYVCSDDAMGGLGDSLFCRVSNTDITASVMASNQYRAETRAILATSE